MKKGILYILLLSYSTVMLKPILPYISDSFAHIFWYSKHMATVHYVNGKFHVHKEVMKEEKKNGSDKNPYSVKKEQSQNDHFVSFVKLPDFEKIVLNKYFNRYSSPLFPAALTADYPPPKVV